MSTIRAQWSWESQTGLPEDAIVNVWHFASLVTPIDTTGTQAIRDALASFYTDPHSPAAKVTSYFSDATTGVATLKLYDLDDAEPRSPVRIFSGMSFTGDLGTGDQLPTEVAVCLSYGMTPVSGLDQANRRGRIYLGPLGTNAIDAVGYVAAGFRSAITAAASALKADSGTDWAVYSPTDDAAGSVTQGWVDNAVDIQRRRGYAATLRDTWS